MAKDRSKTSGLIRVHAGLATHFVCPRWTFRSHVFCEVLEHTLPYFLSILELYLSFMYMRALGSDVSLQARREHQILL